MRPAVLAEAEGSGHVLVTVLATEDAMDDEMDSSAKLSGPARAEAAPAAPAAEAVESGQTLAKLLAPAPNNGGGSGCTLASWVDVAAE